MIDCRIVPVLSGISELRDYPLKISRKPPIMIGWASGRKYLPLTFSETRQEREGFAHFTRPIIKPFILWMIRSPAEMSRMIE